MSIQHAEAMKLNKVVITLAAIVGRSTLFVEMMNSPVNYAGVFKLEYGGKILDARKRDIVAHT